MEWWGNDSYCEECVKYLLTYAHGSRLPHVTDQHIFDYLIGQNGQKDSKGKQTFYQVTSIDAASSSTASGTGHLSRGIAMCSTGTTGRRELRCYSIQLKRLPLVSSAHPRAMSHSCSPCSCNAVTCVPKQCKRFSNSTRIRNCYLMACESERPVYSSLTHLFLGVLTRISWRRCS